MVLRCILLTCLVLLFVKIQTCNAGEFEDRALGWLDDRLLTSEDDVDFDKLKIESNTFESKRYALNYTRNIASAFSLEANVDLNKSKVRLGTLEERLSSSTFELVSWWHAENYRVGVSQKVVTDNKLRLPNAQEIELPENKTLSVHMEFPVMKDKHRFTMSLQQSAWDVSSSHMSTVSDLIDNQVKLNYSMDF